jgi:DNA-directed RNA polymerase subunit RPC12/RpoP
MTKLELEITNKIFRIECSNGSKTFVMTFDKLEKLGIVKCPHCKHEHFLMKINNYE